MKRRLEFVMSFLPSGKTPRTMFSEMPPKTHDVDTAKSEVLAYIAQEMSCDTSQAIRMFNSMRHPKCRVLVFDRVERQWKGCSFRPSDAETSELSILREHRALERQVAVVRSELRRLAKEVEVLKKSSKSKRKGRKTSNEAEEEPSEAEIELESDSSVDDLLDQYRTISAQEREGFIPQINMEEANRIALIAQQKRQKELEAEQKENLRKAMMISH